jgi:hypothetical protein
MATCCLRCQKVVLISIKYGFFFIQDDPNYWTEGNYDDWLSEMAGGRLILERFANITDGSIIGRYLGPFHKVQIYIEYQYHSVCPRVGIGTPDPPLTQASVPSPRNQRGVAHSPAIEGVGESQFQRPEKKLSTLSTLRSLLFFAKKKHSLHYKLLYF